MPIFSVFRKNLQGYLYLPMYQVSRHVKQNFFVSIFMPFKKIHDTEKNTISSSLFMIVFGLM